MVRVGRGECLLLAMFLFPWLLPAAEGSPEKFLDIEFRAGDPYLVWRFVTASFPVPLHVHAVSFRFRGGIVGRIRRWESGWSV